MRHLEPASRRRCGAGVAAEAPRLEAASIA